MISIFNKHNLYMKQEYLQKIESLKKVCEGKKAWFVMILKSGEVVKENITKANDEMEEIALRRIRHYIFKTNKTNLIKESQTEIFKLRCQK